MIADNSKMENMNRLKTILKYAALISLVAAYIFGKINSENNQWELVKQNFPNEQLIKVSDSPDLYTIIDDSTQRISKYIVVDIGKGWGGPFKSAVVYDEKGKILELKILTHKETPSFFTRLQNAAFFEQFKHSDINSKLKVDEDINAVSGATISSKAFTNITRKSTKWLAENQFNIIVEKEIESIKINSDFYILIVLYLIIFIGLFKKYRKVRYVTLAFSVVYLGFIVNSSISVSNISAVVMGFFPTISENIFIWVLFGGAVLIPLVVGKNIYCYWMCPFGGTQEFINLIGGIKIKISKETEKYFSWIIYFLFWLCFVIMFTTNNPSLGIFEPFATLYSFYGIGVQWYIVSIAIIGSFLIPRFWCRFFCPVGTFLNSLVKIKSKTKNFIKSRSI